MVSIDKMSMEMNIAKTAESKPRDIAGRLLLLRRQKGISQEELADAVGVSRQAVSKWEGAQSMPDIERLLALSEFFSVSTDWLLKGEELSVAEMLREESPQTAPLPNATRQQAFLAAATALVYIGLFTAWALFGYYQVGWEVWLGLGFMIVAGAVLSVGLADAGAAREQLWRRFWRYNVWPVAYLLIAVVYSFLASWGTWLMPWISMRFTYFDLGLFGFAYGSWLIVCVMVWRWAGGKKKDETRRQIRE